MNHVDPLMKKAARQHHGMENLKTSTVWWVTSVPALRLIFFLFLFLFSFFFFFTCSFGNWTGKTRCYCRATLPYVAFTWKHPFSVHRKALVDICNLTDHSHIFLGDFSPISRHWRSHYWGCEGNIDIFATWATRLSRKVSEKNRIMNHIAQERTDLWLSFEHLHFYLRFPILKVRTTFSG